MFSQYDSARYQRLPTSTRRPMNGRISSKMALVRVSTTNRPRACGFFMQLSLPLSLSFHCPWPGLFPEAVPKTPFEVANGCCFLINIREMTLWQRRETLRDAPKKTGCLIFCCCILQESKGKSSTLWCAPPSHLFLTCFVLVSADIQQVRIPINHDV